MQFDLEDLLQAVGPPASLIFAAWIFLSFLQQRYVAAFERFRELTSEYRRGDDGERHRSVGRQIGIYRRRCEWMRFATNIGIVSAILLISTLVIAALNVVTGGLAFLPPIAAFCAIVGLLLVIAAAAIVYIENDLLSEALDDELSDIPELAHLNRPSKTAS
ncbi:MAG: conserved rane protein of unknown function [Bradyrhizobium sp.]|nr:conserved rane protein of unknown function [Bradyrhizobium sp.]